MAVPYAPQDVQQNVNLVEVLDGNKKNLFAKSKKGFSSKKTSYVVEKSPEHLVVDSWRFQEYDYKRDDLPTYARGFFTGKNEKGQPEICIRGYDKFFNTDEVQSTKWAHIEKNTKGPYELSLKENGCIIFMSGLHDGTLLVCSKHSTGPRKDEISHAEAGDAWIDKQLKRVGKTRAEFAANLRARNATAVAELCDDAFEEHILAYTGDEAGLYLHGINLNTPEFATYPANQVQAFADQWGFQRTDYLVIKDITETRTFLESVAETGSYNGRDVEGFVIRCKSNHFPSGLYQDWFFKYKFEEPYLMYRQWRECTKSLISGTQPRFKKHVAITEEYLLFAKRQLATNRGLAAEYQRNHGIIGLRNAFLKEKDLKGSDIIRMEYAAAGGAPEDVTGDVILVPIATLGCGKTTIALALQKLFNWGLMQNDNVTGKNRPPRFTKEVLRQLQDVPVVFADRNNALSHERKQILTDVHTQHLTARLVALNFVHTPANLDRVRRVTRDRVMARGDNHQTIQAASDASKVHGIMEGFINRFQPLNRETSPDDGFDAVIDLDPTRDSRENLETVVNHMHDLYPRIFTEMPTSEDLDNAIQYAIGEYKPDLRHDLGSRGAQPKAQKTTKLTTATAPKKRPLEYISVKLSHSLIINAIDQAFNTKRPELSDFLRQLQQSHRVQDEFHVTLMHRASAKTMPELWARYSALHAQADGTDNLLGLCNVQLERIVWDNRVMAIVVRISDENWESANKIPHITVGTREEAIKPKESNDLLLRWQDRGSGEETGISEASIPGFLTLDGKVYGVLSK